jgi:hypothetical protein
LSIPHVRRRAFTFAALSATGLVLAAAGPAVAQTPERAPARTDTFLGNASHTAISSVGTALGTLARKQ